MKNKINREDYREFDQHSRQVGIRLFGWSATTVVAVVLLMALAGGLAYVWAPWKGALEERQLTEGSGKYRIAAYEKFYDSCAAIQSKEDQIENLESELETAEGDRKAQVAASITALRNTRSELIREYNADARKADTAAKFKSSDLPYTIDPEGDTSC